MANFGHEIIVKYLEGLIDLCVTCGDESPVTSVAFQVAKHRKVDHAPDLGIAWSNTGSELMNRELTEISQTIRSHHHNKITMRLFLERIPLRWMSAQ